MFAWNQLDHILPRNRTQVNRSANRTRAAEKPAQLCHREEGLGRPLASSGSDPHGTGKRPGDRFPSAGSGQAVAKNAPRDDSVKGLCSSRGE